MRLLFTTTPLHGHFRPMLPLARVLRDRGHEVAFATAEQWHPNVTDEGLEALAAGAPHAVAWEHTLRTLGPTEADVAGRPGVESFSVIFAEGHAAAKAAELLEVARSWRADAIVHESADLAGPAVATALGLPTVHHSWGTTIPPAWFRTAAEHSDETWAAVGLSVPLHGGVFDGLYLDLCPPRFRGEAPPCRTIAMRPAVPDPREPPGWLRDLVPPVVYVTLGTLFNDPALLRTLVGALDVAGSAVVTTGRDVDPAEVGAVPANVRVERFVPQGQVLPFVAAAIGHGGSGSTLGALAHGVPLVLLPLGADQFVVAERAAAAGAAVVLRVDELTTAGAREALRTVLTEPDHAQAADALRREIASMPTPSEAADEVEEYLAA